MFVSASLLECLKFLGRGIIKLKKICFQLTMWSIAKRIRNVNKQLVHLVFKITIYQRF